MLSVLQRSACALLSAAMVSAVAGTASAIDNNGTQAARADRLDHAATLIRQGQVIEAKSELVSLNRTAADTAEKARILELIASADRALSSLDEVEISLQKAELASRQGDLRLADSHANAARRSDKASPDQRLRASKILDESALMRDELAPMIAPALDRAVVEYTAGHHSESKAILASIARSGVTLSSRQSATLLEYQKRVLDLERTNGQPFDIDVIPVSVLRASAVPQSGAALASSGEAVPASALPKASETTQTADVTETTDSKTVATTAASPAATPPEVQVASAEAQDGTASPSNSSQSGASGDTLLDQSAQWDAERVLREADVAFDAGRFNEAIQKYTEATTSYAKYLSPEQLSYAENRLREARGRAGLSGAGLVQETISQRDVQRQQVEAEVANLMTQADDALKGGDTARATDSAAEARLRWKEAFNQGIFSEEQYRAKLEEIEAKIREIRASEEAIRTRSADEQAEKLRVEREAQENRAKMERETRIAESLTRLRALQAQQKYTEALQVVDEVLFLDPGNPAALLMKDILRDVIHYREWEQTLNDRARSIASESLEVLKGTVVPGNIIDYPADWPDLSFRRGEVLAYMEAPENRKVLATLEQSRIPASFTNNSLEDVLAFIGTVTNLNLDIDWDSLEQIGIERDAEVSLELREVPARVVLDRVLRKVSPDTFSKASWAVLDGVLVVASDEALRKNTFIEIYDVRDLLFQVPDYARVPELDVDSVLQGNQGGGGGGGSGSIIRDQQNQNNQQQNNDNERVVLDRLLEIIQTNVDFEGWRDNGGDTGIVQELNGNLIITNTASNHRAIVGLLSRLREIRNMQISVETRFLAVSQDFFEKIGFDLDVYFNADNNQFRAAQDQQRAFGAGTLTGEGLNILPSDLIGARSTGSNSGPQYFVTEVDEDGGVQYGFDVVPTSVVAPSPLSIIPVQQGSDVLAESLLEGSEFAAQVLGLNPALGIAGTFLDDVQVDFLVEATQADRRSVVLTAPRLTFTNGRTANIYVATQQGFISDLTPIVGSGAVAFDPTLATISEGFTLVVRGVVSADRRYVTMAIQATIADLQGFEETHVTANVGGGAGGGASDPVTSESPIQLPISQVSRVQTGVTVPDQGTILLGGQRVSNEIEVESGVPVLSKIPFINRFFTNRAQVKEEQTLLVLLKPVILIQNEEEEKAFPGLLDKLQNPLSY